MPKGMSGTADALASMTGCSSARTSKGVRIVAPWNAALTALARSTGERPVCAGDYGATVVERLQLSVTQLAVTQAHGSRHSWVLDSMRARASIAAQTVWRALASEDPAFASPTAEWGVEPIANGGLRVSDTSSARTVAVLSAPASARQGLLPYLAAAIRLLPQIVDSGGHVYPALWERAVADAWSAYGWALGHADGFAHQNANVLWVNADAEALLAGQARAGCLAGPLPVAVTVKLACDAELWVRADSACAQLTLVSPEGEDLHAVRIPACELVGGVHTIEHEGLRAQLVVAKGRADADGRTAVPLREALAGGRAFGCRYNNALGMITVGDEGGRARVRAAVAGLSQPLVDEIIAAEDLGVAMGPMVLRRFQQRREAGVPTAMVLAAHEVALMRGHVADAIDAAGGAALSVTDAASVPVVSSSAAGM